MNFSPPSVTALLSRNTGISVIVIDHNYTHLFDICDRINVIQQGQVTLDADLSEISLEEHIELMVQSTRRELSKYMPGAQASAETVANPPTTTT
jgi:ABC-type sugar transport system ATPase subunit